MADDTKPERFSLSRWSRRKLEASRAKDEQEEPLKSGTAAVSPATLPVRATAADVDRAEQTPVVELPPVESLTIDSDFTPFLRPEVDDTVRRAALRQLFRDPRFNVMDGLDVYIDDYTKTVPIPDDVLGKLAHARYIFDPPKTRMNAEGFVEDAPPETADDRAAPKDHPPGSADPIPIGNVNDAANPGLQPTVSRRDDATAHSRSTTEPDSNEGVEGRG